MIIIPELETVVILVPRTGSGSLRRAIASRYPRSTMIYRHMEADGVPHGYDRWPKVGVVRHPVDRLWSLYKFLKNFTGYEASYVAAMRRSVNAPFCEWLVHNREVFTNPYDRSGGNGFFPVFSVLHSLPENQKSQFVYLRPDLGTRIYRHDELHMLESRLGVRLGDTHKTDDTPHPRLTQEAERHVNSFFDWDLLATGAGPLMPNGMSEEETSATPSVIGLMDDKQQQDATA